MANKEHFALLTQDVQNWNEWRRKHSGILIDLKEVNFNWLNIRWADLRGADLRGADLRWADLRGADLCGADLHGADLCGANLHESKLCGADLRWADLRGADLCGADLREAKLYGANFSSSDLQWAELSKLDLSGLDFSGANFYGANLIRTLAIGTNFTGAKFTSCCLEDWNINSATKLDEIDCQYVYLKGKEQERYPNSGEFKPGEFTKLFKKALETVDLIFHNKVDWEAFAYSFRKIQVENAGAELAIQSIENRGDGVVLIKVNASPDADKTKIHSDFVKVYETAHKQLEPRYQARLEDKDKEINKLFHIVILLSEKLGQVPKIMAEQPKVHQNFTGSVYGVAGNVEGDFNNYLPEQKQKLAEAAAEIQELLQQLEQTNPTTTISEKMTVVAKAVNEIEKNPTLKARVIGALKSGSKEALKEAVDHPLVNILLASIEGWQEAE